MPRWSSVLIALALASMVIVPLARARPWAQRPVAPAAPPPAPEVTVVVSPTLPLLAAMNPDITFCGGVQLSVLVTPDRLFAGLTVGDRIEIPNVSGEYDWDGLESTLRGFGRARWFADHNWLEIAATDDVAFEHLQQAIAVAHAAGFSEYRVSVPEELSVRFFE